MVTVVHHQRQERHNRVERHALDVGAELFQLLEISRREQSHAAHIIVDYLYLHALVCFLHQNLKHTVPHNARADNEILNENEMLRLFDSFHHVLKHTLAERVICDFRARINGISAFAANIAAYAADTLVPAFQLFCGRGVLQQGEIFFLSAVYLHIHVL